MKKKIYVIIADGVSIKNFVYTDFYDLGIRNGYDIVFWNTTNIDISKLGYKQNWIKTAKVSPISNLLKTALIRVELDLYKKRFNDPIYQQYKFSLSFKLLKNAIKSVIIKFLCLNYNSEKGAKKLRAKIIAQEMTTAYYKHCKDELLKEQPAFVFSTSQRSLISIAPLTAAQELGIPTATFIYSWDNIPKATTVVTADHYFVWSLHMKEELLKYQPYIDSYQIRITGTPQFENHFNQALVQTRDEFCDNHGLDLSKKYICFSGDDTTTSPKDELYLRDLAHAVYRLNEKGHKLGIIFRRCPVDFSARYDGILNEYKDLIKVINPDWNRMGKSWNTVFPQKGDLKLQTNIIAHTECVVNLGSSMVFDYAAHNKPCAFMNYHYLDDDVNYKEGVHVYNFVHFRSMPSTNSVVWFSSPDSIGFYLQKILKGNPNTLKEAKKWFKIINLHPPASASKRIWEQISKIH